MTIPDNFSDFPMKTKELTLNNVNAYNSIFPFHFHKRGIFFVFLSASLYNQTLSKRDLLLKKFTPQGANFLA